jgi:taurine dioxygenase
MVKATRLPASFGAEVHPDSGQGVDADAAELRALMVEHGLLVFRGQPLAGAQQKDVAACFGRVSCDSAGQPMEMHVSNRRQSSAPNGELIFHYDYAYDPEPITFISLYGEDIEQGCTPTLFASSARPLDRLPPTLRSRIDGLTALQACFMDRTAPASERAALDGERTARGQPGWGPGDWRNVQQLVWRNGTGTESLYACLQHTVRIMELPIAESDALLEELFAYLYAPENIYTHHWRAGDLVVWDNITVQHCRPSPNDKARTLRRYEVSDIDLTEQYLAVGRANNFL